MATKNSHPLLHRTLTSSLASLCAVSTLCAPAFVDADDDPTGTATQARVAAATPLRVRAQGKLVKDAQSPSGWSAQVEVDNPTDQDEDVEALVDVAEFRGGGMSRMPAPPVVRFHQAVTIHVAAKGKGKAQLPVPKGRIMAATAKVQPRATVMVAVHRPNEPLPVTVGLGRAPFGPGKKMAVQLGAIDLDSLADLFDSPPSAPPPARVVAAPPTPIPAPQAQARDQPSPPPPQLPTVQELGQTAQRAQVP